MWLHHPCYLRVPKEVEYQRGDIDLAVSRSPMRAGVKVAAKPLLPFSGTPCMPNLSPKTNP